MFLECLQYSLGASATEHGCSKLGESQSLDGVKDAREVRAIYQHAVLVADVNDDANLAVVFTVVDIADSTCLDVGFKHLKTIE